MGSSNAPPPAPNPQQTAAAQTASNRATAQTNFGLQAVNQSGPQGSLQYNQVGKWPDGTPRYEAVQSLSPEQQGLYNQYTGLQGQANTNVGNMLQQPFSLDNSAVEGWLMELGRSRLDPMFAQRWNDMEGTLLNRGAAPGGEAYKLAQDAFNRDRTDAYNQLLLQGRGQSVAELLAQRNQPLAEWSALGGGRSTAPNYINTPNVSQQPTDVAGITNAAYQNDLQRYGIEQKSNDAFWGGLMGLGGTIGGGLMGGPFGASIGGKAGTGLFNYFGK